MHEERKPIKIEGAKFDAMKVKVDALKAAEKEIEAANEKARLAHNEVFEELSKQFPEHANEFGEGNFGLDVEYEHEGLYFLKYHKCDCGKPHSLEEMLSTLMGSGRKKKPRGPVH